MFHKKEFGEVNSRSVHIAKFRPLNEPIRMPLYYHGPYNKCRIRVWGARCSISGMRVCICLFIKIIHELFTTYCGTGEKCLNITIPFFLQEKRNLHYQWHYLTLTLYTKLNDEVYVKFNVACLYLYGPPYNFVHHIIGFLQRAYSILEHHTLRIN